MRRRTNCCSVRSGTAPPPSLRPPAPSPLLLHRHLALCVLVGGKLLAARRVAVVAEEEGRQIRVGLRAELSGPVRRHQRVDVAEQRRNVARTPVLAEIRTLERRAAEL